MIDWITIYILFGIFFSLLVDFAYVKKEQGHIHFADLSGTMDNASRIITIILWPILFIWSIILIIKDFKNK